jgi:small GTP-binding protein
MIEINGTEVKLQIWDTAGQERFQTITTAYFRNAMGVILVYDITEEESFKHVSKWLERIEQHATRPGNVIKILVGNKCDMEERRKVSKEAGRALADQNKMLFFETSAKLGLSSDKAFTSVRDVIITLATKIFEEQRETVTSPMTTASRGVNLSDQRGGARSDRPRCCRS